jgi:hypothetical protein
LYGTAAQLFVNGVLADESNDPAATGVSGAGAMLLLQRRTR